MNGRSPLESGEIDCSVYVFTFVWIHCKYGQVACGDHTPDIRYVNINLFVQRTEKLCTALIRRIK